MASNDYVNIGMAVADTEQVVHDLRKNTPSLLWVAGIALAYVMVSAGLFRYVESCPWSFGEALYFTALNVFAGSFQLNYEPSTALGRLIAVVNPLAGLILFGIFIAILTMIFQPSEWSFKGDLKLFGNPASKAGGGGHQMPTAPSNAPDNVSADKLAKELNDALARAERQLGEREAQGKDMTGLSAAASRLRGLVESLREAQREFERAEKRLREVEKEVRGELIAVPFYLGAT